MLSIISPAKSLDLKSSVPVDIGTQPQLVGYTEKLIEILQLLSVEQLKCILRVSHDIAALNHQRFINFEELQSRQAIFAYNGDVYKHINKKSITTDKINFLQSHISIISGLYGLLKPLDLIKPYRLEMSTRLPDINLYDFWGRVVTETINQVLLNHKTQYLINLSSAEYTKIVNKSLLSYPMINIHFKEYHNKKLQIIGISAKKARGLMTDYIIKNSIDQPEALKDFTGNGYIFDSLLSSEYDWIFIKKSSDLDY